MSEPFKTSRPLLLNPSAGLTLTVAITPAACVCLEEMTGESIFAYVKRLGQLQAKQVYTLLWAYSKSDRVKRGIGDEEFDAYLDLFPAPGESLFATAQEQVYDLTVKRFFGQTWAELQATAQVAEAQAARMIDSVGSSGPTGAPENSDGAPAATGTE